jgi:glycosyltransferase involved in cell wall biosynthesis
MTERMLRPLPLKPLSPEPLVSVLMPVYNYAKFLAIAIESVLCQTYSNFELLICDDGSTDNSLAIARQFAADDARVKVVHKENGGQASALNAAFARHTGEIVCILDADDIFLPHKLHRVVKEYRDHPDEGVLVHSMILLSGEDKPVETIPFLSHFERGWIGDKLIRRGGRWRFMPSSALSFRAELGVWCMPIPEVPFRKSAESFVFTILPLFTRVGYVAEPLSCYRMHENNMTGEFAFNPETLRYRERCMRLPTRAVNNQLAAMGYSQRLCLSRNLDFAMIRFKRYMLEAKPVRARLLYYGHLVGLALRDDLLSFGGKLLVILGHGASLLLNRAARQWLFDQMISPHPLKRFLRWTRTPSPVVAPPAVAPARIGHVRES